MQRSLGQITWLTGISPDQTQCPACGSDEPKHLVLETTSAVGRLQQLRLVACSVCDARYWTDLTAFQYEHGKSHPWATAFYIEQGAGVDALIEPISRLPVAQIKNCLEIGCGFGFSIDAARFLFGWKVLGVDPSPLARAGATALNIDVRPIYAGIDTELGGPFDVVYGSEVIEHVATPGDFLHICRAHLAPDGVLVLTTPDADSIRPDVPASALTPILSPGHHLVLFNAKSLERSARKAGFREVRIVPREHGLVLYASNRPIPIDPAAQLDRDLYRTYLMSASARPAISAELSIGLRYRLLKEFVNAGEHGNALALFTGIAADVTTHFGTALEPSVAPGLVATIRAGANRGDFGAPFCFPGLLFFRGMIALNGSPAPAEAVAWFDAAAVIATAFRSVYRDGGFDDGETGTIERLAPELAMLALCHNDPAVAVKQLRALAHPGDAAIERVTLRLLDLGAIAAATDAALMSSSADLSALVEGWRHLLRGADAAAHAAFSAIAGSGDIALRARSADVLALASIDADAAVALGQELHRLASVPIEPLFVRLVDQGRMNQAEAISSLLGRQANWDINARLAMLALLHTRKPAAAAKLFRQAFDQASGVAPDSDRWRLRYHELLALIKAEDANGAGAVACEVFAAADAVPADVRHSVQELLNDHPDVWPKCSLDPK